jgi:hypothetical protein
MKTFKHYITEIFGEPEDSNFTHEDHQYDLNGLLSATVGEPEIQIPVSKLKWIMKWDPMTKEDEPRIDNADLSAPLLIIKDKLADNQWVVLDGIHRLAKALKLGVATLPAIVVTQEQLDRYQL